MICRVLFVAWQSQETRTIHPVARLVELEGSPRYELCYVRGVVDAQREGFLPFGGMKVLERVYHSDELQPLFTNRLMSETRPDYRDYIERLGLDDSPEPLLVLARSEGRKATDNLELFGPPEYSAESRRWLYYAFARGVRHISRAERAIAKLSHGDALEVHAKPVPVDPRALILTKNGEHVGWVPRTMTEDLSGLLERGSGIDAVVARVNLPPAPLHQRLLVRLLADHQEGFRPFSTNRYEPMSECAVSVDLSRAAIAGRS